MSTSLYYTPIQKPIYLGKSIKYKLAPYIFWHDWTLGGEEFVYLDMEFYKDDDTTVKLVELLDNLICGVDKEVSSEAKKLMGILKKCEGGITLQLTS